MSATSAFARAFELPAPDNVSIRSPQRLCGTSMARTKLPIISLGVANENNSIGYEDTLANC